MTVRAWYVVAGLFVAVVVVIVGRELYLKFRSPRFECRKDLHDRVCYINICAGEGMHDVECFDRDAAYCFMGRGQYATIAEHCFPSVDECNEGIAKARDVFGDRGEDSANPIVGATCHEVHADEAQRR